MLIYKAGSNKITLKGTDYIADENGIIDVPDDKIDSSVWASGFVSARGRLQELEAQKPPETISDSVPVSLIDIPVSVIDEKTIDKPTKPTKNT